MAHRDWLRSLTRPQPQGGAEVVNHVIRRRGVGWLKVGTFMNASYFYYTFLLYDVFVTVKVQQQ